MKKYILPLIISLFVLFGCSDSNEDEPIVNNSSSFPNIDNTQAMGVGTNLSAPTNTNVKLDSMKMYYYENTSFHPNLPGASYRNQVLTTPVVPTLFEAKHYFTYNSNGFVDKRTIFFDGFYDFDTNFKFIFDYDYNDVDRLQSVFLTIEANGETIYNENLEYVLGIEDDVLSQMQTNQFNITNYLEVHLTHQRMFSIQNEIYYRVMLNYNIFRYLIWKSIIYQVNTMDWKEL